MIKMAVCINQSKVNEIFFSGAKLIMFLLEFENHFNISTILYIPTK